MTQQEVIEDLKKRVDTFHSYSAMTKERAIEKAPPQLILKGISLECRVCEIELLAAPESYNTAKKLSKITGKEVIPLWPECSSNVLTMPTIRLVIPMNREAEKAIEKFQAEKN